MSIHEIINSLTNTLLEYGVVGLAIVSFIESSFFPIPPDVFMIPLALMNINMAWWLALITTVSSALGALLGMWIGRRLGRPILLKFVNHRKLNWIQEMFKRYGGWAIFVAAFTPIPFKVFTIAAGVFQASVWTVLMASLIGRGSRFFLIAGMMVWIGEDALDWISRDLGPVSFAAAAIVLLFGYIYYRLKN